MAGRKYRKAGRAWWGMWPKLRLRGNKPWPACEEAAGDTTSTGWHHRAEGAAFERDCIRLLISERGERSEDFGAFHEQMVIRIEGQVVDGRKSPREHLVSSAGHFQFRRHGRYSIC